MSEKLYFIDSFILQTNWSIYNSAINSLWKEKNHSINGENCWRKCTPVFQVVEAEEESESEVEMEDDDEDEIPLEMEDIEAISKKARQDEDLNTEHLQVMIGVFIQYATNGSRDFLK